MRADPKGDLGRLRSGIPSLSLSVTARRRAQFPRPGPPTSFRVYAGAQAGAQSCWRRARSLGPQRGANARCQCAVRGAGEGGSVSGWGWEEWRMGFPLPRGIKDHDISPQSFLAKAGACLNLFPARMHVLGESGRGEPRSVPKISALGNVFYRGAQRRGYPCFCQVPRVRFHKGPNPLRPAGPRASHSHQLSPRWWALFEGRGARLHVDFLARRQSSLEGAAGKPSAGQVRGWTAAAKGKRAR